MLALIALLVLHWFLGFWCLRLALTRGLQVRRLDVRCSPKIRSARCTCAAPALSCLKCLRPTVGRNIEAFTQ